MIYKFECDGSILEIDSNTDKTECRLSVSNGSNEWETKYLTKDELFKLIGALHMIQKDLK